jgi:molybdate transport system ATP-binding protein
VTNDRGLFIRVEQRAPVALSGSLSCAPGQLVALVGPSGAGKTSLLRVIAGLMAPAVGVVRVDEQIWCDTHAGVSVPTRLRHVGFVFQNYALMPHLNALDNVALALLEAAKPERSALAAQHLVQVGLPQSLHQRRPSELSGGQQQRVALARALARQPQVLLLDEPFSAVDQPTRQGLYTVLAELRRRLNIPMVLVTHDLREARLLADKLVVMDEGRILQSGTPYEIDQAPCSQRVTDLVGV